MSYFPFRFADFQNFKHRAILFESRAGFPVRDISNTWSAPIGWSSLNVNARSVFGLPAHNRTRNWTGVSPALRTRGWKAPRPRHLCASDIEQTVKASAFQPRLAEHHVDALFAIHDLRDPQVASQ